MWRARCASRACARAARNPRFPQCLARIAATESDYGGAIAWYSDAIALVPEERALYDEILEVLNGLIEQGTLSSNVASTRALATRATEILKERMRRWPKSAPPVSPEELYTAIGILEMNAGGAKQAEEYFRESLASRPTAPAALQYGLLLERTSRPKEAREQYKAALDLLPAEGADVERQRAELIEHIRTRSGSRACARTRCARTRRRWRSGTRSCRPQAKARWHAQLRRGVVLGRLARFDEAKSRSSTPWTQRPPRARPTPPSWRFWLVSAPDAGFAQAVFRTAQNQLGLEPEWRVYFALWLRMIAVAAGK